MKKNFFEIKRDKHIQKKEYEEYLEYVIKQHDVGYYDQEFFSSFEEALLLDKKFLLFHKFWKHIIGTRIKRFWHIYNFYVKSKLNNVENYEPKNLEYFHAVSKELILENDEKYPAYKDRNLEVVSDWYDALWHIDKYIEAMQKINATEEIERAKILKESVYNLKKPKAKKTTDRRKMSETLFWELIEESRTESDSNSEFVDILKDKLEAMATPEIKKFQKLLLEITNELEHWDMWALAYIVRRGCGDDEFDYFKAWVISQGKETFEIVKNMELKKIKAIFEKDDPQFEAFMHVAQEAYENKKHEEMPIPRVKSKPIQGKEWKEENICQNYAKLCEMFEYKD